MVDTFADKIIDSTLFSILFMNLFIFLTMIFIIHSLKFLSIADSLF